jgi:hypothetical protein
VPPREFFEDNDEEAVRVFTSERLQSFYVEHPNLVVQALDAESPKLGKSRNIVTPLPSFSLLINTIVMATELHTYTWQ